MAQEGPNRLFEWLNLIREEAINVRDLVGDWLEQVREEPALIWATPVIRYATYGVAATVVVWVVSGVAGAITPPPPASARPAATTADFHVVCTVTHCEHHFVIHREFGFHRFPVQCPRCQRETGVSARKCSSPTCMGRWVAPVQDETGLKCPRCGARFE